jgi:hypothetical protein
MAIVKFRVLSEQTLLLKKQISVWYKHKTRIFTHNLHRTELQFSDFCCDNGSPDGLTGLTDQASHNMVQDSLTAFLTMVFSNTNW